MRVTLKEDLSRLKQQNGSNVKQVPGDKDTNIGNGQWACDKEQMCVSAEQAMARGTSPAELMCHKSEEESNNYVMDDSQ